jgi:hypothetical protein
MKTHWKQLVNPDYLGAYSLPDGKDMKVKITKVAREMVVGVGGRSEECTVAHIESNKPLILNRTNCKTIQKIYGTPYIEEWKDKYITLYAAVTKLKGEDVECLRIRAEKPELPELLPTDETNWNNIKKALSNGFTIDQVRTKWVVSKENEQTLNNEINETV